MPTTQMASSSTTSNNDEITPEGLPAWLSTSGHLFFRCDDGVWSIGEPRGHEELSDAINKYEWKTAEEIVKEGKVTWTCSLNDAGTTALDYALGARKDSAAVKYILDEINEIDRELLVNTVDKKGLRPAHTAAVFGNKEALEMMFKINPECLFIPDNDGYLPIHYALAFSEMETFLYLFNQMKSYNNGELLRDMRGINLFHLVIVQGLFDLAHELINYYPSLATTVYKGKTALECIIRKPELFYSGTSYSFYERLVYHIVPIEKKSFGSTDTADEESQLKLMKDNFVTRHTNRCLNVISGICDKLWETTLLHVPQANRLKDDKVKHDTVIKLVRRIWDQVNCEVANGTKTSSDTDLLYSSTFTLAAENNTPEAIAVMTKYRSALYASKKDGHNALELTVLNGSEKVYNYILDHFPYATILFPTFRDHHGNNILHLAGHLAPTSKRNAASAAFLHIQERLKWIENLERLETPAWNMETLKLAENTKKETPVMVFKRQHGELLKVAEAWMKKTADSYKITAALIITIAFAGAITVPGGNDSATGKPVYEKKASLNIFAISNAISMFTATTSLLLFLSILTARFEVEDFRYKLPKRLIFGLVMLFVSVTSMMIAFSAALYITFGQERQMIMITIAALACLPIASFVTLQFPLLFELISSTYGHGMFGEEKDWQSSANANKEKRA